MAMVGVRVFIPSSAAHIIFNALSNQFTFQMAACFRFSARFDFFSLSFAHNGRFWGIANFDERLDLIG